MCKLKEIRQQLVNKRVCVDIHDILKSHITKYVNNDEFFAYSDNVFLTKLSKPIFLEDASIKTEYGNAVYQDFKRDVLMWIVEIEQSFDVPKTFFERNVEYLVDNFDTVNLDFLYIEDLYEHYIDMLTILEETGE